MPRFLDVEASSLDANSYPIEVAWSDDQGNIESYLINPYAIEEWTDWDYHAQQIHGISRKMCRESGMHPERVCNRMSNSIRAGETIYADGMPYDEHWIDTLYGAGSMLGHAQFRIVHSDLVMLTLLRKVELDNNKLLELYERLKLEAHRMVGARHRVEPDVQYLIELWKHVWLWTEGRFRVQGRLHLHRTRLHDYCIALRYHQDLIHDQV